MFNNRLLEVAVANMNMDTNPHQRASDVPFKQIKKSIRGQCTVDGRVALFQAQIKRRSSAITKRDTSYPQQLQAEFAKCGFNPAHAAADIIKVAHRVDKATNAANPFRVNGTDATAALRFAWITNELSKPFHDFIRDTGERLARKSTPVSSSVATSAPSAKVREIPAAYRPARGLHEALQDAHKRALAEQHSRAMQDVKHQVKVEQEMLRDREYRVVKVEQEQAVAKDEQINGILGLVLTHIDGLCDHVKDTQFWMNAVKPFLAPCQRQDSYNHVFRSNRGGKKRGHHGNGAKHCSTCQRVLHHKSKAGIVVLRWILQREVDVPVALFDAALARLSHFFMSVEAISKQVSHAIKSFIQPRQQFVALAEPDAQLAMLPAAPPAAQEKALYSDEEEEPLTLMEGLEETKGGSWYDECETSAITEDDYGTWRDAGVIDAIVNANNEVDLRKRRRKRKPKRKRP